MRHNENMRYLRDDDPFWNKMIIGAVERVSGLRKLGILEARAWEQFETGVSFWDAALEVLELEVQLNGKEYLREIPQDGPVIVIANHPFGLADGLVSCKIANEIRDRFQVLINAVICREERLKPWFLPIDYRDTREVRRENVRSRRRALELLKDGQCLLLYPAGGVSTRQYGFGELQELPWGDFVSKIALQTKSTVLPVYYSGQNSLIFHLASQIHTHLRSALYVRETRRLQGKQICGTIRRPILPDELANIGSPSLVTDFLYRQTMGIL